jgi:hypothetical protein
MIRNATRCTFAAATALTVLSALGPPAARAGLVIDEATVQEIGDPTFLYRFVVTVPVGCTFRVGDFLTIYDLFAPTDTFLGTTQPAGFGPAITPTVGPTPGGVTVNDDPTLFNVSWTYAGPTINGPQPLGTFSVTVVQPAPVLHQLAYSSTCSGVGDVGFVTPQLVPEPASWLLLGVGGGLIGSAMRRRRGRVASRA